MHFKKEFYRLKEAVQSPGIRVVVYKSKSYFKNNDAAGYVDLCEYPRKIFIAGKAEYKFLIMRLLHEYGHVLDYNRWVDTTRWKLYSTYLEEENNFIRKLPHEMKRAILYSEFIADEKAKQALKIFKSHYPISLISDHQFINVHTRNFELTYGKETPPAIVDIFLKNMHQGITKKNFMNFSF